MSTFIAIETKVIDERDFYLELLQSEKEFPKAKRTNYIVLKYASEYAVAVIAFIVFLPLLLVVAFLIKLDSKGPVFFKHERFGLEGNKFFLYKFRTMVEDAHEMQSKLQEINEMKGGGLFKSDNDPRVTKLGKFLRKFSIDELPQLINILKGEMTIIGPRPISTPIEMYEPSEMKKFAVKPGLGCIWQAYFRKETDFRMWMKTDCIYVDSVSWALDLKLFVIIAINTLRGKGAR